jgi:transaldolase
MRRLLDLKQSVWLDYLSRGMTRSGELHEMIADGLRGMTSNPTIFEHAIGHTSDYVATR